MDAAVQQSSSDEWNAAPSRIVEGIAKIVFREIVEKSDSSERMNLANSLSVHTPELVLIKHTPMQTDNADEQRGGAAATRIADQDGILRPTLSDINTAAIHGESETKSEKLAYRKFIKDSEFETRKLFERENIEERENIRNIETQLKMTRLDDKQMTQSKNSSTCSENHRSKLNLDPDPSSSDSSDSSSLDSAPKRKKSKKKKKRRKHRKDDSSDLSSSDDSDSSKDSHYRHKQRKDKKHQKKRSDQTMRNFNGKTVDDSI